MLMPGESADRRALRACVRLIREALPKFNWGASALDANAIALLNEVPGQVDASLAKPDQADALAEALYRLANVAAFGKQVPPLEIDVADAALRVYENSKR